MKLELSKKNWRAYLKSNNPVAAALLSKMGYSKEEKVEVKKEFLRMITRMELTQAKTRFILGFFDRYLILNKKEEEILMKEVERLKESEDIMYLPIALEEWAIEKGVKQGIEQGIEQGKKQGKELGRNLAIKEVALEMLKEEAPLDLIIKVTGLNNEEIKQLRTGTLKSKD